MCRRSSRSYRNSCRRPTSWDSSRRSSWPATIGRCSCAAARSWGSTRSCSASRPPAPCASHSIDVMSESFIATLAQVGALIRKEILALVKDPASRVILFAPALVQSLLFGYGATYDLTHVPYAVLEQSRGAASAELLARVDGTGVFFREATLTSPRQIAEVIDRGEVLLVLSIPPDFQTRVASRRAAPLQLI